jgi:hypothetical protein
MHAKAVEAAIGIGDGVTRTDAGDQLYRDAKRDPRFRKTEPGKATFTLTESAPAAGTSQPTPTPATRDRAFLSVGADRRKAMYHAPGDGEVVGTGLLLRPTTGCGLHLDVDSPINADQVPLARRCRSNGCASWWNEHEERVRRRRG